MLASFRRFPARAQRANSGGAGQVSSNSIEVASNTCSGVGMLAVSDPGGNNLNASQIRGALKARPQPLTGDVPEARCRRRGDALGL